MKRQIHKLCALFSAFALITALAPAYTAAAEESHSVRFYADAAGTTLLHTYTVPDGEVCTELPPPGFPPGMTAFHGWYDAPGG